MKKHKTKIIAAIIILTTLAGSWFLGGSSDINLPSSYAPSLIAETIETPPTTLEAALPLTNIDSNTYTAKHNTAEYNTPQSESNLPEAYSLDDTNYTIYSEELTEALPETTYEDKAEEDIQESTYAPPEQAPEYPTPEIQILGAAHPDMRDPIEPEDMSQSDDSFTVFLTVRADMILYNMHLLDRDKHELVPLDGVIFPRTEVIAYAGESVFNVLQREMRRNGIHMASRFTPMFNSAYVEAINNLYEFDVGPLSGWMYRVNGWFPNFGASRYLLVPGDEIEWLFTVDLGRDLGVDWVSGGQRDD